MNSLTKFYFPYVISLGGVILDYLTSLIGIRMGFHETHANYHPFNALVIFWGVITILLYSLPKGKRWRATIYAIALISYIGALNNLFVILGIFQGLNI